MTTIDDLVSAQGSSLIGYQLGALGKSISAMSSNTMPRDVHSKLDEVASVFDFMTSDEINDVQTYAGTVDVTTAVQAAIDACGAYSSGVTRRLYFPSGIYLLTSTLTVTSNVEIFGIFPAMNRGASTLPISGTWLYFNHSGVGMHIHSSSYGWLAACIHDLGTFRSQSISFGTSWRPGDFDYDFYIDKADDSQINNIALLNPTLGIRTSSRCAIQNIYGQPFTTGIYMDDCLDVVRIDQVHFWDFWTSSSNTGSWTMNNLDALLLGRIDNPMICNVFCIFSRSLIHCTVTANGKASKVKLVNADADQSTHLLWIDDTATSASIEVSMLNVSHQGYSAIPTNSRCIWMQGSANRVSVQNLRTDYNGAEAFRVEGENQLLQIGNIQSVIYAAESSAYMGYGESGSTIEIGGQILYDAGTYSLGQFSSGATFISDFWQNWEPVVTSSNGDLSAVTGTYRFRRKAKSVLVNGLVVLTDIGTATGTIRLSVPYLPSSNIACIGSAKELTLGTEPMICYITSAATVMAINGASGASPLTNGHQIAFQLEYGVP